MKTANVDGRRGRFVGAGWARALGAIGSIVSVGRPNRTVGLMSIAAALAGFACLGPAQAGLSDFGQCSPKILASGGDSGNVSCAEITLPRDYDDPADGALTLPIIRVSSQTDGDTIPVFYFSGGPGGPNADGVLPLTELGKKFTTYYIGYRGADGSDVFDCPEIDAAVELPDLFSKQTLDALASAGGACAERLNASGVDLANYTMLDVLADMEAVRVAIGATKVNLISVSYGTRLAQYYSRLYPDSVARSALIAANPPGHFVFSTYVNDQVLNRLRALCAEQPDCRQQTKDLKQTILNAVNHKTLHPEADIDDGASQLSLFFMLYGREGMRLIIESAIAAENGDIGPLKTLNSQFKPSLADMLWGDLFAKGSFEGVLYPRFAHSRDTTLSSMGSPLDKVFEAASRDWNRILLPAALNQVELDLTETLVLSGELDVATPHLYVEAELMPFLPNGELVVLKDMGHSDFRPKGDEIDRLITLFLETGDVDRSLVKQQEFKLLD